MKDTYYITTPIYYPSDKLHIGHSYTTVAADTMTRYKKQRGFDVKFLTGTDEHGQKIERLAKAAGITPKEYVDKIVVWIKDLWKTMNVEYDIFLRTTDELHVKAVQKIFKRLYEQGDIYKNEYEGMYCTPCETFFTERQLVDGKCPDCNRPVEKVKEESYFFRMSKYQDRLLKYIEDNPEFIMPVYRRNEMVSFIKSGLDDLCVSRTSFKWGIPVDFDDAHVVYVWIDALSNYATALGYLSEDDSEYRKFWPADVHLVAKDIVRFHTIIWPIMLMALGEPVPKQVFAHGYLIIDGGKMSKSKGNVVDPKILIGRYGVDAIRYFLLREFAFGQDGNFTNEGLIQRINSDLANDLGNLVSRTVGMIDKYFEGQLPAEQVETVHDKELKELAEKVFKKTECHLDKMEFSDGLVETWNLIRRANKYVDETEPWVLAKDTTKKAVLANVLYNLSEALRIAAILIGPVMPNTKDIIFQQLNIPSEISSWSSGESFGRLEKQVKITKGAVIFPRIDVQKELESLNAEVEVGKSAEEKPVKEKPENVAFIGIEDFAKVEMKMGKIVACEKVEGSDKLLKSQVQVGGKLRQIVSGIGKSYSPEDIVGKNVVVVTNLKPVKLKGQLSEGMLLAASDDKGLIRLITSDGDIADGTVVR